MNDLFSRIVRATIGGRVAFLATIFIPAGTVDDWQGWAFADLALNDRELLLSRLRMGPAGRKDVCSEGHHGRRLGGLCHGACHHCS
jgi:hypothetical protein